MTATFDMTLVQRGARLRRSPYFEATLRAGCRSYTVYNHMFLPTRYDDLHAEYERLLTGVTVWDVSVERQVEITGLDAFAFTNLLTPRDLSKCAVGQGKYVLITAEDGGIVNDPVLLRLGENHFWLALADSDVLLYAKGVALNSGLYWGRREFAKRPGRIVVSMLPAIAPGLDRKPFMDLLRDRIESETARLYEEAGSSGERAEARW